MATETKSNAPVAAKAPGGTKLEDSRHEHQILTGRVTSAKMEKTIVVEVLRLVQHPKYRRVVRISKKFYAHDEKRQAKPGDTVRIVASRPISKLKRWRLKEVLARNVSEGIKAEIKRDRGASQ
jgi:small subunit ribosomal protein S17